MTALASLAVAALAASEPPGPAGLGALLPFLVPAGIGAAAALFALARWLRGRAEVAPAAGDAPGPAPAPLPPSPALGAVALQTILAPARAPIAASGASALRVLGLEKRYGDLVAVAGLEFEVRPGEILGLVGPNGAGKTTTLRCLAGAILPSAGQVWIAGHPLATAPVEAKKQLAFLPDEPRLFEHLTALEHLNFVAHLYGVADWAPRAAALFAELELSGKEHALPGELSRGMKQKLAIAGAFLHDPAVVLLDEPLTGLDPLGMRRMKQALLARAHAGAALVLSSHLLALVEEVCHRVLVVDRGRAVALGTVDEIRAQLRGPADASLEDLFVRLTTGAPT